MRPWWFAYHDGVPSSSQGHYPKRFALHSVLLVDVLPDETRDFPLLLADHVFRTDIPVTDLCGGRGSQTARGPPPCVPTPGRPRATPTAPPGKVCNTGLALWVGF